MRLWVVSAITYYCAACCASLALAESRWAYVVPTSDEFPVPPIRGYLLNDHLPDGVQLHHDLDTRGARYGQVRYGSPDSARVTIMVAVVDGESRLYVDADRDRTLSETDFITGTGPTWQLPLAYVHTSPDPTNPAYIERTVELCLHRSGKTLSMSTAGYLQHDVKLDGQRRSARMVDGDVSGRFGDADDRLWIDLDGDGSWDRFLEQFPSRPIVRIADRRYTLLGDERGEQFSLNELTGAGTVQLELATAAGRDPIDYRALLVGVDQLAISLGKDDGPIEVPVGRYRVATLSVKYDDVNDDNPAWNFVFSGVSSGAQWYEVKREKRRVIEPLTDLKLVAELFDRQAVYRPGDFVGVAPRVHASAGLVINSCTRGTMQPWQSGSGPAASIQLWQDDTRLDTTQTGFA